MSQVQLTLTLTIAEAAAVTALLAGGKPGNASTVAPAKTEAAATSRTAEAGKADAQTKKDEKLSEPSINDFKAELVPLLQAFAKKDKAGFEALMKKHGFAKVTDIEAKPESWGALALACKG